MGVRSRRGCDGGGGGGGRVGYEKRNLDIVAEVGFSYVDNGIV